MDSGGQAQYQKQMPQKAPVWLRTPEERGPWLPEVHEFFRPMFCSLTLLTMLAYRFFENWSTASRQLNRVWRKSRTVPQTVRCLSAWNDPCSLVAFRSRERFCLPAPFKVLRFARRRSGGDFDPHQLLD